MKSSEVVIFQHISGYIRNTLKRIKEPIFLYFEFDKLKKCKIEYPLFNYNESIFVIILNLIQFNFLIDLYYRFSWTAAF